MIKLQQLIGLPVLVIHSGKREGTIKDAIFDSHWKVTGLVLESSGWFVSVVKTVDWNAVLTCGVDAIIISDEAAVQKTKLEQLGRTFCTSKIQLKGMPMVTVHGVMLGQVSDVYFHPFMGTPIVGFELTDGFISDLMEGRKWLRAPEDSNAVLLGEDAIIVPAVSEAELEPVAASNSKNREK
ncbi:Uncharacterized protein YrrD, contains PRC-barrel domain [Paenibacillus algorifonticola]|uniref:Uncharacterized protein YrrD, contains PRC-barrel domain n=1 Tax=Paenibacillus algorifonticola TaxID=684063 RepID=A0A1I2IML4_9BACL|nr:photosystem reaction center subunit H [Paenibacillus algorifonticola]SFF42277.1 Uncharacterized protein YrrD, contains PRC-barrel domain [Paenibacillus algorifonticola]